MRLSKLCVVVASVAGAGAGTASGFIVNGDFEAGNTGFSSDYAFRTVSNSPNVGQYGVTTSTFAWSQFWNTISADHTTGVAGSGKFLIADGQSNLGAAIWRQTVSVPSNTEMTLSGWTATWTTFAGTGLRVEVNGVTVGSWGVPPLSTWTQSSTSFNSGAGGSVTIALYPTAYFQPGADIAIDDLSLVPTPGTGAMVVMAMGVMVRRRR